MLITKYFYFIILKNFGTRSYLLYWGRDSCGIVRLWVIFKVLIAAYVKRAVVLVVTKYRLIKIYYPFFSSMKWEVVGSSILMVETELVPSSKTVVSFYYTSISRNEILELCNRCSASCTLFAFNGWMWQCCSIKCTYFSCKREIVRSENLNWVVLSWNRNREF